MGLYDDIGNMVTNAVRETAEALSGLAGDLATQGAGYLYDRGTAAMGRERIPLDKRPPVQPTGGTILGLSPLALAVVAVVLVLVVKD